MSENNSQIITLQPCTRKKQKFGQEKNSKKIWNCNRIKFHWPILCMTEGPYYDWQCMGKPLKEVIIDYSMYIFYFFRMQQSVYNKFGIFFVQVLLYSRCWEISATQKEWITSTATYAVTEILWNRGRLPEIHVSKLCFVHEICCSFL